MARARIDTSIQRQTAQVSGDGGDATFDFPLGVYPVEPLTPIEGYTLAFESADDGPPPSGGGGGGGGGGGRRGSSQDRDEDESWRGGGGGGDSGGGDDDGAGGGDDLDGPDFSEGMDGEGPDGDGELEPWPDRYVFDINIRASRVESLCRQLFAMLPGRIFPILDVMGNDGYREIDPFIAYDLVGLERFLDAVRRFKGWFFEDGMVGFGAMSEEPFIYIFVDEHKIVTVRVAAGAKEQVEKILQAFDLEEVDKIAGADAAVHEHRGVLDAPSNRPDLLTHDEIVEQLKDDWGLTLNVDPFNNNDESGTPLGLVPWRCIVRVFDEGGEVRYAEAFLTADSLQGASELAISAAESLLAGDDPTAPIPELTEADLFLGDEPLPPFSSQGQSTPPDNPSTGEKPDSPDLGTAGGQSVDKPGRLDPREGPEGLEGAGDFTERKGRGEPRGQGRGDRDREGLDIPMDDLSMDVEEFDILVADRIRPEDVDQFPALVAKGPLKLKPSRILSGRWME